MSHLGAITILCGICALALAAAPGAGAGTVAAGCDAGWVTEMEREGYSFANSQGKKREAFTLLRETGFDSVRLRVWTGKKGFNTKADVVAKALRAKRQNLKVMVDFHLSDTWADPGRQTKPREWAALDADALAAAIECHVTEVLTALKKSGVEVAWVQIGNEIRSGVLWDADAAKSGALWEHGGVAANRENFRRFIAAGCKAAKAVFPDAATIVHCDKGQERGTVEYIAGILNGIEYDIFGVSLYSGEDWRKDIESAIGNLGYIAGKHSVGTMVCEFGMPCGDGAATGEAWKELSRLAAMEPSVRGIFYWEPLAFPGWRGYMKGASRLEGGRIVPSAVFSTEKKDNSKRGKR